MNKPDLTSPSSNPEIERTVPPQDVWANDVSEIARDLGVDIDKGLPSSEAASRLEAHGPNDLAEGEKDSALVMFLKQF